MEVDSTLMNTNEPLNILLLAAEVVPFAKTGGLADERDHLSSQ